jgi:predicted GNAT family acetyltransferase
MSTPSTVRDNLSQNRFELDTGGETAVAYYLRKPGVITFTHTEVPPALSGQGIGSKLVSGALELVRAEGLRVIARCPFISAFIAKHPEFQDLLY